jgi:hypothetical protein
MTPVAGNTAVVTVAPSSNQTYQVIYTLAGCSGSANKTVNVFPKVTASAGGNQTYCLPVGSTINLGRAPTASGGGIEAAIAIAGHRRLNLSSSTVANPTITPVSSTAQPNIKSQSRTILTLSTSVDSMVLTLDPTATVTIASPDTNICSGQSSVLAATARADRRYVSGGHLSQV